MKLTYLLICASYLYESWRTFQNLIDIVFCLYFKASSSGFSSPATKKSRTSSFDEPPANGRPVDSKRNERGRITIFTNKTRCFVWGMQPRAVQVCIEAYFI